MTGHFVQLITLQRKICFRASAIFHCTLFVSAKEKKQANERWVFQSSVSIGVYVNTVKFSLTATSLRWPLQLFYPGGQSIHLINDQFSTTAMAIKARPNCQK